MLTMGLESLNFSWFSQASMSSSAIVSFKLSTATSHFPFFSSRISSPLRLRLFIITLVPSRSSGFWGALFFSFEEWSLSSIFVCSSLSASCSLSKSFSKSSIHFLTLKVFSRLSSPSLSSRTRFSRNFLFSSKKRSSLFIPSFFSSNSFCFNWSSFKSERRLSSLSFNSSSFFWSSNSFRSSCFWISPLIRSETSALLFPK